MQRPVLVNGILLALVCILGALAWLSMQEQNTDRRILLTQLHPDQVNLITLTNQSNQGIQLKRKADGWMMQHPYVVSADDNRIQRLLEIVRSNSFSRFQSPADVADYGLAPPVAKLTLNQIKIEAGNVHPMNQRRYLRLQNRIHLIKDRFIHHLQASAEEFIDPALFPNGSRINAILTPKWQLSFHPSGKGSLTPPNTELSADDLNQKHDQWLWARAGRVMPAPEDKNRAMIEIKLDTRQQPIRFELDQTDQHTLLIRRDLGLAYVFPKESELLQPPKNTSTNNGASD